MASNASQLIAALNHPIRRRILRVMDRTTTASASELAETLDKPLSRTSYHVNVLARLEVLELTGTKKVRGATERFFRSTLNGRPAWARAALEASRAQDSPVGPEPGISLFSRSIDYRLRPHGGLNGNSLAEGQPPA
jgi:DNA-binding transcriptional ArsR family regulator